MRVLFVAILAVFSLTARAESEKPSGLIPMSSGAAAVAAHVQVKSNDLRERARSAVEREGPDRIKVIERRLHWAKALGNEPEVKRITIEHRFMGMLVDEARASKGRFRWSDLSWKSARALAAFGTAASFVQWAEAQPAVSSGAGQKKIRIRDPDAAVVLGARPAE